MDIRSDLWTPIKHGILPCPFVKIILSGESPDQDPLKCMTCNWNYRHASCLSSSGVLGPSISSGLHLVIHGESCTPDVLFICRGIPNTLAVLLSSVTATGQLVQPELLLLPKERFRRWTNRITLVDVLWGYPSCIDIVVMSHTSTGMWYVVQQTRMK